MWRVKIDLGSRLMIEYSWMIANVYDLLIHACEHICKDRHTHICIVYTGVNQGVLGGGHKNSVGVYKN